MSWSCVYNFLSLAKKYASRKFQARNKSETSLSSKISPLRSSVHVTFTLLAGATALSSPNLGFLPVRGNSSDCLAWCINYLARTVLKTDHIEITGTRRRTLSFLLAKQVKRNILLPIVLVEPMWLYWDSKQFLTGSDYKYSYARTCWYCTSCPGGCGKRLPGLYRALNERSISSTYKQSVLSWR